MWFLAGIVTGSVDNEFSFGVAFIYWVLTLISGTMILGFAEIIKLLYAIKNKSN